MKINYLIFWGICLCIIYQWNFKEYNLQNGKKIEDAVNGYSWKIQYSKHKSSQFLYKWVCVHLMTLKIQIFMMILRSCILMPSIQIFSFFKSFTYGSISKTTKNCYKIHITSHIPPNCHNYQIRSLLGKKCIANFNHFLKNPLCEVIWSKVHVNGKRFRSTNFERPEQKLCISL
jgi:hypothetical protein